jgi:hypothetical protein
MLIEEKQQQCSTLSLSLPSLLAAQLTLTDATPPLALSDRISIQIAPYCCSSQTTRPDKPI